MSVKLENVSVTVEDAMELERRLLETWRRGGDTLPLRAELCEVLALLHCAAPGRGEVHVSGNAYGAVFLDGGGDVYLPIEELSGYAELGFSPPPGAIRRDVLNVFGEDRKQVTVLAVPLTRALRAFREVRLWHFENDRYTSASARVLLRGLAIDIALAGGPEEWLSRATEALPGTARRELEEFLEVIKTTL